MVVEGGTLKRSAEDSGGEEGAHAEKKGRGGEETPGGFVGASLSDSMSGGSSPASPDVSPNQSPYVGATPGEVPPTDPGGEHISVATLNVRSLRSGLRAQSVLTFLEGVSADIICLQECGLPFRSSYGEWERKWPHGPSRSGVGQEENPADGVAVLVRNRDKTSFFFLGHGRDCRMVDVFRSLHPGREGFTWASADGSRASRIDFLFARGFVGVSASLAPVFFTDHSLLLCSLAVGPGVSVGRGAWRLNCSLLESQVVREAFRAQYAHWQTLQGLYGSRAEWWEERRLNRYFSLLHGGFDFRAEVEEVKREMAAIAARRSQSIIFRSKEREVDEGETCSRFF
ncbi:hypothetical protein AAFF_G00409120 [Aldrovandia affinis]|uniref:Endonuclease/exonuclease/phosphatase domain-containing protein n=1 Tax=Aldrovandia affinis TaxID=143900 RepID=A0AAD7R3P4_9TELE|nr:hypothetical protein AAFF_G00409120 [Aldrovandia affinis]